MGAVMGRVKDHFWEEICASEDYARDPTDLEILEWEAEQSRRRYEEALKKAKDHEPR